MSFHGQPALAPVVGDQPAVHPHPDPAVRVQLEQVVAALGRLDRALPPHADLPLRRKRGVDPEVRLLRPARDLDVDPRVDARGDEPLEARPCVVRAGQAAGLPRRVEEPVRRDGSPLAQVAEAGVRRVVPEDAVAAAGDEEGHDHGRVVLPELEVVPLHVHQAELVLAEAVERLVLVLVPLLAGVEGLLPLDLGRHERAPALLLDEDRRALRVEERDPPRGEVHADLHLRGGEGRLPAGVGALDADRVAPADAGGQARPVEEGGVAGESHAHDVVGAEGHSQVAAADRRRSRGRRARAQRGGRSRRAAPRGRHRAAITRAIRFIGFSA